MARELNQAERDLLERLVCMGAVAPMRPDGIDDEKLEEIIAGMPEIYRCTIASVGVDGQLRVVDFFDLSGERMVERAREYHRGHTYSEFPEMKVNIEYSPEAWIEFFRNDLNDLDPEVMTESFARWNIQIDQEAIPKAFREPEWISAEAQGIYFSAQMELTARLVLAGIIDPVDFEDFDVVAAEQEIKMLPPLARSHLLMREPDGRLRHVDFLDVVDYSKSRHLTGEYDRHFDFEWQSTHNRHTIDGDAASLAEMYQRPDSEEPESLDELKPADRRAVDELAGIGPDGIRRSFVEVRRNKEESHLRSLERIYFYYHPEEEMKCLNRSTSIEPGTAAWLEYFRRGVQAADPMGKKANGSYSLANLRSGLKNWESKFSLTRLEQVFGGPPETKLEQAQLLFHREILSKLVKSGVIPRFSLPEWRNLDLGQSEMHLGLAPLLPGQTAAKDWLEIFNHPVSQDYLDELEMRFDQAGIPFDREKISSALSAPVKNNQKNPERNPKMARNGELLNLDDYRMIAGQMIAQGRLEMSHAEMMNQPQDELADYIRAFDSKPTPKQLVNLDMMAMEKRISLSHEEIGKLSFSEVHEMFQYLPGRQEYQPGEGPTMSQRTHSQLQGFIDKKMMPPLRRETWDKMTETDAQKIISFVLNRNPISQGQRDAIAEMLRNNPESQDFLRKVAGKELSQLDSLTMQEASQVLDMQPATEKQQETVAQLIREQRISPVDVDSLTKGQAKDLLNAAYSTERDPTGPATENQLRTLKDLMGGGRLPQELTEKQLSAMTFGEAQQILTNAPCSNRQRQTITNMMENGRLNIPELTSFNVKDLTFGQASTLIDIGQGKKQPGDFKLTFMEDNSPATESQKSKITDLFNTGKIEEIPENLTKMAASKIIQDAVDQEPITPQQEEMLRKFIARGKVPPMTDHEIGSMSKGKFQKALNESIKNAGKIPEPGKNDPPGAKNRSKKQMQAAPEL